MSNQTVAEKILSRHAGKTLRAGDFTICKVDFAFGQDGTSSIIIDRIRELGVNKLKTAFCMVIDHSAPSPSEGVSRVHKKMRDFSRNFKTEIFDIGCGVCHQVIPESGNIYPGNLVLGADSHTCTYGAIGAFSTGVGSTDLAIALACGKSWFKVPATVKIIVGGKLAAGVFAKDIILEIIGQLKSDGATYKSVEFCGPAIDNLGMDGRFTIANMLVEMGAKCGFMPVDKKTVDWLKLRGAKVKKIAQISADKGAVYEKVYEFDAARFKPMVSMPHSVDNIATASSLNKVKINEAFLGTCTNGRIDDFKAAAKVLNKRKVNPQVRLIIAPSSRSVYLADTGAKPLSVGCLCI